MNSLRLIVFCSALVFAVGPASGADRNLTLKDLANVDHQPLSPGNSKATVLLFVWHTCPVANSYAPEIQRIYEAYKDKNISFYLVQTDPDLKISKARQHAKDYAYTLPVLIDRNHDLVKHVGAKMTPEAAVLMPDGEVIYRGRIDNRQTALGKRRPQATVFDLRETLDAILAGDELTPRTTKAIGCYIPETD